MGIFPYGATTFKLIFTKRGSQSHSLMTPLSLSQRGEVKFDIEWKSGDAMRKLFQYFNCCFLPLFSSCAIGNKPGNQTNKHHKYYKHSVSEGRPNNSLTMEVEFYLHGLTEWQHGHGDSTQQYTSDIIHHVLLYLGNKMWSLIGREPTNHVTCNKNACYMARDKPGNMKSDVHRCTSPWSFPALVDFALCTKQPRVRGNCFSFDCPS